MTRNVGVTETLVDLRPEWTVDVFAAATALGDWKVLVAVCGLFCLADVYRTVRRGEPDDGVCADRTAFLVAVVFGGIALALLLKSLFEAPRPPEELHAITPSDDGFPSGHTMVATVGWGALAWWGVRGSRRLRVAAVGVAISVVALSRLALGVHFLVDVLAAVGFGGLYLVAVAWTIEDRPLAAFALAFVLASGAAVASGGSTRGVLAVVGTVLVLGAWQVIEFPPVRRRLGRVGGRRVRP